MAEGTDNRSPTLPCTISTSSAVRRHAHAHARRDIAAKRPKLKSALPGESIKEQQVRASNVFVIILQ